MFSSTFWVSPGRVKLLDPTSACDPMTSKPVGDVRLRVKLVLVVDPVLDQPRRQSCHYGVDSCEEWIALFVVLDALVKTRLGPLLHSHQQRLLRPVGDLVPHQDPDLVELLPAAVEVQQGANLEESRGDIDAARQLRPLAQVVQAVPPAVAVVDDEEWPVSHLQPSFKTTASRLRL